MTSYYADRNRENVPSWDAFEAGDEDEVVDQSEVSLALPMFQPRYS